MARQRRIEYSGAMYHVMARGDRREAIVRNDGDRAAFVRVLGAMCERSGIRVHAYVLMENHYHIVLETPGGNLVEGMRWLQNTYTRRFNVCHRLWGHVFGDRYKALVIDDQGPYFRHVVDYVHLNPARAGITDDKKGLAGYAWSSLPVLMMPSGQRPGWLAAERLFAGRGMSDTPSGRRAYLEQLEGLILEQGIKVAGVPDKEMLPELSLQATIRRGWYFGSQAFKERLLALLEKRGLVGKDVGDGYHGEQMRAYGEAYARRLLERGSDALGIAVGEWGLRKANDPDKVMLAEIIASQTTVRLDWLRRELKMGSRGHCSRLINDQRRRVQTQAAVRRKRSRILKIVISND